jgi:hypothetical protein
MTDVRHRVDGIVLQDAAWTKASGEPGYVLSDAHVVPFYPARLADGSQEEVIWKEVELVRTLVPLHAVDFNALIVVDVCVFVLGDCEHGLIV